MKQFLLFLWVAISSLDAVYAGNPPPPSPQGIPPPDPLPIDSNIIVLILIAIGLGIYSITQKRKTSVTQ